MAVVLLAIAIFLLFFIIFSQQAFDLTFLRPTSNQQSFLLAALSAVIFLLFVALIFVLLRTLLKLYGESGASGSNFRTRMVLGALLLSCAPVIVLFVFAYGLMNRSVQKWFSMPVEQVRRDTSAVANLLRTYAANNATLEAKGIAASPEAQRAFSSGNFAYILSEFRRHDTTLESGFILAIVDDHAEASYHAPDTWPALRAQLPTGYERPDAPPSMVSINGREFMLGRARVGDGHGIILVALPLPANFFTTLREIENSERRYFQLNQESKALRRTYIGVLLLLTVLVLFAATWLALFVSKLVTRPVAALAAATEEISRGRFDYRVEVPAGDELGKLVQSFNRMAQELDSHRRQLEASSLSLGQANTALEQRRQQMETILESIPTGVLSLDAHRAVTHMNSALARMFHSDQPTLHHGALLQECFPPDMVEDLERMLRKSERMGAVTQPMEIVYDRRKLDLAVTVASLQAPMQSLGYVLVFEDLSGLLKAQKQAAWREVARRVAHEIKNPLTPIALSAERIRRHLERGVPPDEQSLAVIHGCAETIAGAVETVRSLVDEFSTLARFPASQPQPADINSIVQSALGLFDGRLQNVRVQTFLAADLPKVLADPEAMKRAIANLVDNAAEAVQDSMLREIQISTALLGRKDAVEVVVADTGHGVTQDMKEKLFLPYFSTKKRGTGLGLTIVGRIIEDHGGSIRVEENRPLGARFIVELRVAPEAANGNASESGEAGLKTNA